MNTEISIAVISAITLGLVQVVKQIGAPSRFLPLFAIAFGVALSILTLGSSWPTMIVTGLIAGLTSVGLYSGTKNLAK